VREIEGFYWAKIEKSKINQSCSYFKRKIYNDRIISYAYLKICKYICEKTELETCNRALGPHTYCYDLKRHRYRYVFKPSTLDCGTGRYFLVNGVMIRNERLIMNVPFQYPTQTMIIILKLYGSKKENKN